MKEISGRWYLCDPEKNRACRKRSCSCYPWKGMDEFHLEADFLNGRGCFLTSDPECAQRTEDGKRIRIRVSRMKGIVGWDYRAELEG